MNLKTIDLCAGIGGIRRGFELAGDYRNIASAEIDEMACKTYEHLFHEDPRNDVTSEEFKKHLQTLRYDVLMAGFPCQAFSSVGLQQGFEDKTKGTIFFDIAKIIKMTRPKVIFLENVQNLLSHDKQATFKTIIDTLDRQLDYHIVGVTHDKNGKPQYERSAFLRNSRDFGVPQNRPRVYIVAFSRAYFGQHISILPKEAPCKRSRTPVFENLKDVLDEKVDPRFFLSSGYLETLEKHIVTQHDTVMLVNDDEEKSNGTRCLFQPTVKVESEANGFRFCEYSALVDFDVLDSEERSLELQYRNKRVYGTGLGTSVNWNIDTDGNGEIYNDFFPEVEVPQMDFTIPKSFGIKEEALSMRHLSDLDKTEKSQKLSELRSVVDAYGRWIDTLVETQKDLPVHHQSAASINISGCLKAKDRMLTGLRILDEDSVAWAAFSLANRAMFMQRVHLKLQSETGNIDRYPRDENLTKLLDFLDYTEPTGITGDKYAWRLFQIAFLLMSIESITNDSARDRDIVDLIWFPTGGGKTEAYLGLTAFTIFFRRLAHLPDSDGTTVIMRYTLRLLAAQQFTRASTLICACEYIRSDAVSRRPQYGKYPLGNTEITIGLWIGREHIPNTNADAKKHLKELTDARTDTLQYAKEQHNKFQVLKCPWCGTKLVKDRDGTKMIGTFGYRMRNNRHFELFCPQESCFFNQQGKLPIQIIDEELYASPPTLLFGTVDKFAMIPWKKEIGAFFAAGTDNRAPDLVIQDELHLISGPLGTMVGLYEAAIDALCTRNGIRPKIVASTATIRRAKEQCSALYNREVSQFPHPGLDAEDSFFARESIIDYDHGVYGRKYVGLMPSGKTKAMMEVRSIAALMQEINIMDLSDDIKDKFWTLTVYFNSLKDLGKCSTLVDDDVKDFIKRTAFRLGSAKDARMIARADELTSRVNTTQLNETLDKLEKHCYSKENIENKRYPSNVLLATNMISVGIDVARLNVMLLVGQPKLTSEYIQASSRVGRSFPGVAFALYDGSKSRDRSHYEQFKPYHESFYKHVEPTGATPFSKPARDRALHAVMIAMVRVLEDELSAEKGAAKFNRKDYAARIAELKKYITERASDISKRMNTEMVDDSSEIALEIDSVFEKWEQLAENFDEEHFYYGEKFLIKEPDDGEGRLMKPFNTSRNDPAFDTMTSMRNVDSTVAGNVLIWEEV